MFRCKFKRFIDKKHLMIFHHLAGISYYGFTVRLLIMAESSSSVEMFLSNQNAKVLQVYCYFNRILLFLIKIGL